MTLLLAVLACRPAPPVPTRPEPGPWVGSADLSPSPPLLDDSAHSAATTDPAALLEAGFLAGFPLVFSERILARKPYDTFVWHSARPNTELDHVPNPDVIYGFAVVDLRAEPAVIHTTTLYDRYWSLQLADLYVESFAYLGTRATGGVGGDVVVVPPGGYAGALPPGLPVIEATTTRIVVLARLHVRDDADVPAVVALQPGYTVTPLSAWLGTEAPPIPPPPQMLGREDDTGTNGVLFWDELGDALVGCPPRAEEAALFEALAPFGIGPGRHPSEEQTDPELLARLEQATVDGLAAIAAETDTYKHWIPELHAGRFDGDYLHRAAWCSDGWITQEPVEAVYTRSELMDGTEVRILRMDAAQQPPVDAFWSVAVYAEDGHLVANPWNRYSLQSTDPSLVHDAYGGVEIRFAPTYPGGPAANWLPVDPARRYDIMLRAYLPAATVLDGSWRPPDLALPPP